MIQSDQKLVAEKWFQEYFTKGNVDILDEVTDPAFVYHTRNGASDKQKMKEFMGWFRSVFHDDEWQLDDMIEEGEKLVVRYTGWMTYKGGWFNIPSTDQRVKETGNMIFYFENGKVKELWCENSDAAILFELGALVQNTHKVY
ncbi:ester cyclase [Radiobacillus kanasensis]|uniref:ester cyclase n=1 Tax=Radiobacillus kanasensis TaxID=2844358 RepID=UPI001E2EA3C6|nr:ester cyclase [Radiobacillus kanasensis]UFU00823.1 ester cyclase [Radiobacillus kanasensis]